MHFGLIPAALPLKEIQDVLINSQAHLLLFG
jgi:hypothetical protein